MSDKKRNEICRFVQNPFFDCYCFNLTSQHINSAIYYCGNHFNACKIYKKNISINNKSKNKKINSQYVA